MTGVVGLTVDGFGVSWTNRVVDRCRGRDRDPKGYSGTLRSRNLRSLLTSTVGENTRGRKERNRCEVSKVETGMTEERSRSVTVQS